MLFFFSRLLKFSSLLVTGSVWPCQQSCVPFTASFSQRCKGFPSRTNPNVACEFSHHPPLFRGLSLPLGDSNLDVLSHFVASAFLSHPQEPSSLSFGLPSPYVRRGRGPSPVYQPTKSLSSFFRLIKVVRRTVRLRRTVPFETHWSRIRRFVLLKHHRNYVDC